MIRRRTSTQEEVTIRLATSRDDRDIAGLHVGSFLATYNDLPETRRAVREQGGEWEAVWSQRLDTESDDHATLVATIGQDLVGFVYFGPSPDTDNDPRQVGQILSIHVNPASTGRGVGRALMTEAIRTLEEDGYRTASLWVVDTNTRAKDFYERLGWQRDGARNTQKLSIDGKTGDAVEIVRYRLPLVSEETR